MKKSLTKNAIIKKKKDINLLYRQGKRFTFEGITFLFRLNTEKRNRILVSARSFPSAVIRNRARRIIKEAFRTFLPPEYHHDCMVIVYKHPPLFSSLHKAFSQLTYRFSS